MVRVSEAYTAFVIPTLLALKTLWLIFFLSGKANHSPRSIRFLQFIALLEIRRHFPRLRNMMDGCNSFDSKQFGRGYMVAFAPTRYQKRLHVSPIGYEAEIGGLASVNITGHTRTIRTAQKHERRIISQGMRPTVVLIKVSFHGNQPKWDMASILFFSANLSDLAPPRLKSNFKNGPARTPKTDPDGHEVPVVYDEIDEVIRRVKLVAAADRGRKKHSWEYVDGVLTDMQKDWPFENNFPLNSIQTTILLDSEN